MKNNKFFEIVKGIANQLTSDRISVYAAQASFFVIISVVPFLSLLVSIASFFIPTDVQTIFDGYTMPDAVKNAIGSILNQLNNTPKVSLLSISAIVVLWSAAKGVGAITTGISRVYRSKKNRNIILEKLWSLVSTLVFIALIIAAVVLLLFGNRLFSLLDIKGGTAKLVMYMRTPLLALFMCLLFTLMYTVVARRSAFIKTSFFAHLPGGAFASVGWILFSYFYSLYIQYFPNASYIYGGLAAVCLIMLWLYFCMIILLLGAEVNKLLFFHPESDNQ